MDVTLPADLTRQVEQELARGHYRSRDELIERRFNELTTVTETGDQVTLTGNGLTVEKLNGSKSIQFKVEGPQAITITRPVFPTPPGVPVSPGSGDTAPAGADQTPSSGEAGDSKDGDSHSKTPPVSPSAGEAKEFSR